ncbi:MAG TPA: 3-deoxy-7-phosphoheptulonate synthase [Chlamydiales bacterium]|nr:3-deoxy-7-phosphoheptulonate synthase [Chlamydiales bacterium]
MELPCPAELKEEFPLSRPAKAFIAAARKTAENILQRKDERLAAIVGPCSIHDPESACEYAGRIKKLAQELEKSLFLVMRLFVEKPRTRLGWKGMVYDPHLDGSNDIAMGLRLSRRLFVEMAERGVPCATELLEPLIVPYFDDLITWGLVGARTSASQPHRQLASGLSFPVGFKNDIHGELDVAISGIITSRLAHSHIGIDPQGKIAAVKTHGNPLTHLILRGAEQNPNYDPASVDKALRILQSQHLEPRLIIDCSHGNSAKDHRKQRLALESVTLQSLENKAIAGFMLESHLFAGKQPLGDDRSLLHYGVSITDPCIGWEETELLLRSTSISSVQK